ncbi:hypothetical protein CEH05_01815 [Halobacillus halophilus]|uniref:HesB/YadR/YfhF-family protein n=1 Tax=Halobacillus halophilus (strain ATCC 35676 / DSM 2266 / JCM 20832 / KCTC 3685 / LMG 17431 / NBRC 102448 / NCIMB 2269) TaxID=866895 RepID=I0JHV0_HALH3|nr:hypothetical protein [Halobacillus halophilus]ASF37921.1 hypothetical protein CEH05_01815 [Halobacillus halophilus]CCG43718.1 hypothetical protein HBHAL_1344 [Halobacillus halophilus DSM 2266]
MKITDGARDLLLQILEEEEAACLRLYFAGYGCGEPDIGMTIGEPEADDELYHLNAIPVAIDKRIEHLTAELTIEGKQTMEGPKFQMVGLPEKDC